MTNELFFEVHFWNGGNYVTLYYDITPLVYIEDSLVRISCFYRYTLWIALRQITTTSLYNRADVVTIAAI